MGTKKSNVLRLILAAWLLFSCSPPTIQSPTTQAIPTPKPTTVITQASGFSLGTCDIPEDYYLFLKFTSHMSCSSACNCPEIEPPSPAINRSGDDIYYYTDQVIGEFAPWDPNDATLGLIIWGWFEDQLYVIDQIPFEIPNSSKPLVGCEPSGVAYIELSGEVFRFEPGQGWSSQSVHDMGDGCYETHTVSLVNYGLVEKPRFISDLSIRDENIQLILRKASFTDEDKIEFDIAITGEENVDFSHWCPVTFELREESGWIGIGSCHAPDYVPEPFPRMPGEFIQFHLLRSTIGTDIPYQYELSDGWYRIKFTYYVGNEYRELFSRQFRIIP